ncbi:DNA repair protein RecO [Patescibacteria group bacterium]|nr:DNA repair protein RecO [Patescibacteria group bacterium]MBU4481817.1 DNA repair protein RecO [Patescibacteria group bacterium]
MFEHYRTKGIFIKKEDRGESDQLFTIYTGGFGKLKVLGKGIRKITSKLRSGAEIFFLSEIEFIQGKNYRTLTDAIVLEKFSDMRDNLKRLAIACRISEVLDNLVRGQEVDQEIWQLLNESFEKLNNLKIDPTLSRIPPSGKNLLNPAESEGKLKIVYYYFFWNLFSILGYQPELFNCVVCQKKLLPKNLYFNPKEGGVLCEKCFAKIKKGLEVEPEVIKILRLILERDWQILARLKVTNSEEKSLNLISSVK